MSMVFGIIGAVIILFGIISGFFTGSFLGFILAVISGGISGMIFIGIALILNNQEEIKLKLYWMEEKTRNVVKKEEEKIECEKCGKLYETTYSYCPSCAHRPTKKA